MSALVGRGGVWVDELTSAILSVCVSLVFHSNSKSSACSLFKKASSQCCRFALLCSLITLNFFLLVVCRRYERKELRWHRPSTNDLFLFEEALSKKKIKISSLLHVYLKYFIEQTSYRFVCFYDKITLHNMLLLK